MYIPDIYHRYISLIYQISPKNTTSIAELKNTINIRFSATSDDLDIFFEKWQDSVAEWSKALV